MAIANKMANEEPNVAVASIVSLKNDVVCRVLRLME